MILVEKYHKGSGSAHSMGSGVKWVNYPKTHADQRRRSAHKLYAPAAAASNSSARFSTAFFALGEVLIRGLVLAFVRLAGVFFGAVTFSDVLAFFRASSAASAPSTKPRRTTFSSGSSSIRNATA